MLSFYTLCNTDPYTYIYLYTHIPVCLARADIYNLLINLE